MSIVVGNVTTVNSTTYPSGASVSHNNNGDFLAVIIATEGSNGVPSYGGALMTHGVGASTFTGGSKRSTIYYLETPSSGINNLTFSIGGTDRVATTIVSLSGQKITSPKGVTGTSTTTPTASLGLSTTANSFVIDCLCTENNDQAPTILGADQTEVMQSGQSAGVRMSGSYENEVGTSVTMSWGGTFSSGLAHAAMEILAEPLPPTLATGKVQKLFSTTLSIEGNVITEDEGLPITEKGVVYSVSPSPTTSNSKVVVSGASTVYNADLTGLDGGRLYYARAYAINANGTGYGNQIFFTTDENNGGSVINLDNPVIYN